MTYIKMKMSGILTFVLIAISHLTALYYDTHQRLTSHINGWGYILLFFKLLLIAVLKCGHLITF